MKCMLISGCYGCPKYDHSGGFTPGGKIPLCTAVKAKGRYGCRELPYKFDELTGERVFDGTIPEWCPLPEYVEVSK